MASLVMTGDVELQKLAQSLIGQGTAGKKIFRKGLRAGAKVFQVAIKAGYPKHSGKAAKSAKVKAIKRSRDKIGVRVALYAESKTGYPYPVAVEGGAKFQPPGERIRKAIKIVTVRGSRRRVTDEEGSKAYHALAWRMKPRHVAKKIFNASASQAADVIERTCLAELEKEARKK